MQTNNNITRLLEMLEDPEAYSEQDIRTMIDGDEDTREAYQLIVKARQGYIHRQTCQPCDVQAAWHRFCEKSIHKQSSPDRSIPSFAHHRPVLLKIAACFIGVLLISGISFATIHVIRQHKEAARPVVADTSTTANTSLSSARVSTPEDTVIQKARVFNDVKLDVMLAEIAKSHDVGVEFKSEQARQLRFYFVWKREDSLGSVVEKLNNFEAVNITVENGKIVVR